MKKTMMTAVASILAPRLSSYVYTARSGLITGLKRRGGFGFIPKKALTQEQMFLKKLDLRDKTVYDVGGHVGLMTLFFARAVGQTGRVITFEPNLQNYQAILDHVELNGFQNVTVIPMGLGHKRDTLTFFVSGQATAFGTAHPNRRLELARQGNLSNFIHSTIEVDTLDNQISVNKLPWPDFVKIDVEGLEIDVLNGMRQTISQRKPALLIELHGQSEQAIVEFLLAYGYRLFQVEDGVGIRPQDAPSVQLYTYRHVYAH